MPHPAPAAIAAIYNRLRVAPELAGVRVDNGPQVGGIDVNDVIAVGVTVVDAPTAASDPVYGLGSVSETFDVECAIQSWSGDTDIQPRMERAFELLDAVAAVLAQDPHLGLPEQVWDARIARWQYQPMQDDGALALIEFAVRVSADRTT
jgi:hypothetical protein